MNKPQVKSESDFLSGKSELTLELYRHFIHEFRSLGDITIYPAKSMIGIGVAGRKIAWVTQLGKNFVHIVFPFEKPFPDNLCFQKIAQVPGDDRQYNHHFRMLHKEDINKEVRGFMKMALAGR